MRPQDRYDSLLRFYGEREGVPWELAKAQAEAESGFEPRAVSSAGARGLLQLMPETAKELGVADPFCPEQCIEGGIRYLRRQYDAFPEVEEEGGEKWKFALASYHCGRAYVRRALEEALSRGLEPLWGRVRELLAGAEVGGKRPDAAATLRYVERVVAAWREMERASEKGREVAPGTSPPGGEGLWKRLFRAWAQWFSGSSPPTPS